MKRVTGPWSVFSRQVCTLAWTLDTHALFILEMSYIHYNLGDIVYLPKAWPHMTMNIGETIGIGGQAVYPAAERFESSFPMRSSVTDEDLIS